MSKPNINLHYKEQEGMLLPDLQISNSNEADKPLAGTGGWRWNISRTTSRSDIRF